MNMLLTQTANCDYKRLLTFIAAWTCLALLPCDQDVMYEEFKEQLVRNPEGYYDRVYHGMRIIHSCLTSMTA